MCRSKFFNSRGFTLAEILVCIIILAILASIALPTFVGQIEKSNAGEAVSLMGSIKRAEFRFRDESPTNVFFFFSDQCTAANLVAVQDSLGLDLNNSCPGAAAQKWMYAVDSPGGNPRIVAYRGTAVGANFIALDLTTNVWTGGGTFAVGSANWPNLQ